MRVQTTFGVLEGQVVGDIAFFEGAPYAALAGPACVCSNLSSPLNRGKTSRTGARPGRQLDDGRAVSRFRPHRRGA